MYVPRSGLWSGDPRVKPRPGTAYLDVGHRLAPLAGCWIDAGQATVRDYSPRANTAVGVNGPASLPGLHGPSLSYNGTSQRLLTQRPKSVDLVAALTVAQRVVPRGSFVSFRNAIFRGAGAAQLGIIVPISGAWSAQSAGADVVGSTLVLNVGASLAYTLTGVAGTLTTYTNGRANNSASPRSATLVDADLTIGADAVNARFWQGEIDYTYLFKKALTASDVEWLHYEPYTMFRPVYARRFFDVVPSAPLTGPRVGALDECGHPMFTKCVSWLTKDS